MIDCNELIAEIYNHDAISTLIKKIKPVELQDDLKQEMAMVLLSYDCEKLKDIKKNGNLIGMALMIIWKMGNFNKSYFYSKYKKNDNQKLVAYLHLQESGTEIPLDIVKIAQNRLHNKLSEDANSAHESMIFNKYIELKSCIKVAEYFGIPYLHTVNVVNKMKLELKKAINNNS